MIFSLQRKVSPLENAIETLETTNKRINSLIEQHIADDHMSTNNLGMLLNGVVDASVNGGISNYKVHIANHLEKKDIPTLLYGIWIWKIISLWLLSYKLALSKLYVHGVKNFNLVCILYFFWGGGMLLMGLEFVPAILSYYSSYKVHR